MVTTYIPDCDNTKTWEDIIISNIQMRHMNTQQNKHKYLNQHLKISRSEQKVNLIKEEITS